MGNLEESMMLLLLMVAYSFQTMKITGYTSLQLTDSSCQLGVPKVQVMDNLTNPHSMGSDSAGNVYVTDMNNHRIQKFTSDGKFITMWGSEGSADSQFLHPHGVDVDSAGNVYVTDAELLNVQKFSNDGRFVAKWGGTEGTNPTEFSWLESVDVDSAGNIYVADLKNHRIQKFDSNGNFIIAWGSEGEGDGQFKNPAGGCSRYLG
ncbi:MAG: hypothetical protein WBC70_07245 [Candidatus Aminicenantales bacterium]